MSLFDFGFLVFFVSVLKCSKTFVRLRDKDFIQETLLLFVNLFVLCTVVIFLIKYGSHKNEILCDVLSVCICK